MTPLRAAQWAFCVLVFLFLVAPILAVVPLSFTSGTFLIYPLPGLSLRWYHDLFTAPEWIRSLKNSLIVGLAATALATVLGTLASIGLVRGRLPFSGLIMGLVLSPMIVPVIITAVGLYFLFAPLGITGTYAGLILAHTVLATPFVVITVSASLQSFNDTLWRAAASLGASPTTTFFRVVLPIITPGVVSGCLFAFAASFDEVVTVILLAGPEQRTLPRQMFIGIRENFSPTITAAATFMIVVSCLTFWVVELLRRRSERLRTGR
ncbi:MAG TPA: ABC transporter permease [Stellaceae bacterium]|jgi:putative spermidine/putrescine transport system permease protein